MFNFDIILTISSIAQHFVPVVPLLLNFSEQMYHDVYSVAFQIATSGFV